MVVLVVVPTTISDHVRFLDPRTINRVSLFALIFSIGILVDDDAIVVVSIDTGRCQTVAASTAKSTRRRRGRQSDHRRDMTVVAALPPMMFVSGVMGPT